MQTCVVIQNGQDGWEIIGMDNVIELFPKLAGVPRCFFYTRLDRTNVCMHLSDEAHRLLHCNVQQGLSNDNSMYKPQAAPNHKEPLYVKMKPETVLPLIAPNLDLHCTLSPSLYY